MPGQWWTLFGSVALDGLVQQALLSNLDLAAAQATLRQSRETALAGEGAFYPQIGVQLGYTRQRLSSASTGGRVTSANLYDLAVSQLNIQYTPDIFGGTRRRVEQLIAASDAQRFQFEAAVLSITSGVVLSATQEAAFRLQIAATDDVIAILRQQLTVITTQQQLGSVSIVDVLTQQSILSQTLATLPALKRQLQLARDQLAVLVGRFPVEGVAPQFDFDVLVLPREIPVSLPSALVSQRPDIQIAAEQLHQATAAIGIATANMLPQITLTATGGSGALRIGDLFSPGTALWSIGAGLMQPVFAGGTLEHQRRAALAAAEAAGANYQATVLAAFQAVADALQALQADAGVVGAQQAAADASRRGVDIARSQLRLGGISFLSVLLSERAYATARLSLAQAQGQQYLDTVTLLQALGGGWWNRTDGNPEPDPRRGPLATILMPKAISNP